MAEPDKLLPPLLQDKADRIRLTNSSVLKNILYGMFFVLSLFLTFLFDLIKVISLQSLSGEIKKRFDVTATRGRE